MRVDGVEAVDNVAGLAVSCRVAQRAKGFEFSDCGLAKQRFHVLRFVHDDHWTCGPQVVDRTQAVEFVSILMNDTGVLVAAERLDAHHHDLHTGAGSKRLHLLSRRTAVDGRIERLGVEVLEVLGHESDAGNDALLDRSARHENHELAELVSLGQLEDGAQVDVGLSGAGLHLDVEVQCITGKFGHNLEAVPILHSLQIQQKDLVIEEQVVADRANFIGDVERLLAIWTGQGPPKLGFQCNGVSRLALEQIHN